MDHRLAESRSGSFLIDLRSAPPSVGATIDGIRGTHNGTELELADIRSSFDLMLHVDRVSPWHTWIDGRGHWT